MGQTLTRKKLVRDDSDLKRDCQKNILNEAYSKILLAQHWKSLSYAKLFYTFFSCFCNFSFHDIIC